jgi:hypothetical protein
VSNGRSEPSAESRQPQPGRKTRISDRDRSTVACKALGRSLALDSTQRRWAYDWARERRRGPQSGRTPDLSRATGDPAAPNWVGVSPPAIAPPLAGQRVAVLTGSVSTGRPFSGCVGRLLSWMMAVNALICAAESWMGVVSTIHRTPSEQGGVVNEPS